MPYPKAFYYSSEQSEKVYQRHPTGKPDITRLIQNREDYWVNVAPILKEKKKKLVIADWSTMSWSVDKKADFFAAIEKLIDDGFEIYIWQYRKLNPLPKENLASLKEWLCRDTIIPDTLENLHRAAATEHHIAQDEIHVLDDYWINQLLSKDDTLKPRILSLSAFCNVPEEKRSFLINLLKRATPVIESVIQDEYSTRGNITWSLLSTQFPKEKLIPAQYQTIYLYASEIATTELHSVLTTAAPNLKRLSLYNCAKITEDILLPPAGLPFLESIGLGNIKLSTSGLKALLSTSAKLKKLSISQCVHISDHTTLTLDGIFCQLDDIHFSYSNLVSDSIQTLLAASPRLNSLGLAFSTLSGDINPSPRSLPFLENISLEGSSISILSVQALLAASPQLKTLKLSKCTNISESITLLPGSLPNLEEINFEGSNITSVNIQAILAAAPNLKKLILKACKNISVDITLTPGSLPKLEHIDFQESKISNTSVQALFSAAPQLKNFNLSACNLTSGDLTPLPGSLPDLEWARLERSNVSNVSVQALIAAAPKLKGLDLYGCKNISGDITLSPGRLTSIKSISIGYNKISNLGLQSLLAASPLLESLDSYNCGNLFGDIKLVPQSLPHLEKINLSESNISNAGIQSLLAATTKLKKLELRNCNWSSADITFPPGGLPHLVEVSLDRSSLTTASLGNLFAAAPQLQRIDLSKCMSISPDIFIPGSLPQVEDVNLYSSNITTASLKTLLAAAPQIKTLSIMDCKSLYDYSMSIPPGSLPFLEKINWVRITLTSNVIDTLLSAAPKLEKLDLSGCDLYWCAPLSPRNLARLEEIDLSGSKTTSAILENLLKETHQLKKITLSSCPYLTGDIRLSPGSLPDLEEAHFSRGTFSSASLQNLLAAAPRLKTITLGDCSGISEPISLIPGSLPCLEYVELYGSNLHIESVNALIAAAPKLKKEEILRQPLRYASYGADGGAGGTGRTDPSQISKSLDADTSLKKDVTFQLDRIFYPVGHAELPPVNYYRLDAYQVAEPTIGRCTLANAFNIGKEGDLALQSCFIRKSASGVSAGAGAGACAGAGAGAMGMVFYGKQSLLLMANQWQSLASLSPHERMLRYNTTPETDIEIKYSNRDNLYYIRSKTSQVVDIDFDVLVADQPALPADIKKIADYFLNFTPGALEFDKPPYTLTGEDYFDAMCRQKKGACRHRAFAFKALMAHERPDLQVRIITNDCHSFVEVKVGETWHRCDLGGYPAKLEINERNNPNRAEHEPLITRTEMNEGTLSVQGVGLKSTADFEQALKTWDKKKTLTTTPLKYYEQSIALRVKRRLIECSSAQEADALHFALQAHCRHTSRPVFYVNSPDDLICSAPYMHCKEDNTGELRHGPGGALHEFLRTHVNGVVIVNYGAFKAEDLIRFNTLLDKERKADGTVVPKDTVIIGLLNVDNSKPLPGSDFYSRFEEVESCPVTALQLAESMPKLPPIKVIPSVSYVINLYHSLDWEERLLGHWVSDKGSWHFELGELQRAVAAGAKTIEIQNGVWENNDFCRFWREAQQVGHIKYVGGVIDARGLTFVRNEGYNWPALAPFFHLETSLTDTPHAVLNEATFGNFFSQYQVTRDKKLQYKDGVIQTAATDTPAELSVHVTSALNEDQWAMILEKCKESKVKLKVFCAAGVELPKIFHIEVSAIPVSKAWPCTAAEATSIIQSTDVDTSIAELARNHPDSLILDVSECHASDLLIKTNGAFINKKGEALRLEFSETSCAVARALEKGRNVILHGRCSAELAAELTPFLMARQKDTTARGKLMIVSGDTSSFKGLPQYAHAVTAEEKQRALQLKFTDIPAEINAYLDKEPLSTLAARCRFIQRNRELSSDQSWSGLSRLPATIKDPGALAVATSKEEARQFTLNRLKGINTQLTDEPYVFLTGLSGVGKSIFVTQELCSKSDTLYSGESSLLDWAKDTTAGKRKLLFLDEANLSANEWSAFEGLFNSTPGILIDGEYYPLSAEHKVIFAGNPISYGDERKLAPFFKRHGNALVFEPLPSSVLFERVLKPVFIDTLLESKTEKISRHLLEVYRFLCLSSDTDILISPRELQMMALLAVSYCSRQETAQDVEAVAKYFAYHLSKSLVPAAKRAEFDRLFQPSLKLADVKVTGADFLITPSRQHVSQLLDEFLALREIRHEARDNPSQQYGGLGGLILDGEPGIGKSEMVVLALRARGYEEMHNIIIPATSDKPFYHMQVSMPLAEKEKLLRKAFNEGALVVIDEINSSPMMEQLLNALLMGTTPEGSRPEQPGFMVIGTQNPISMGGRRAPSTALARRMTTVELPPYSPAEVYDILLSKGLPVDASESLVKAYQTQIEYAKANCLTPAPTFRDLLKLAERIMRAHEAFIKAQSMDLDGAVDTDDHGPVTGAKRKDSSGDKRDFPTVNPAAPKHPKTATSETKSTLGSNCGFS